MSQNDLRLLPEDVSQRIIGGQVIIDLKSAVKELIENSIDAGATSIEIRLVDHGQSSIEVRDNGSGISQEDFENLACKSSTSKITKFDDIHTNLSTFGFRGEALNSLCAIGDLVVITRVCTEPSAFCLVYDHSGSLIRRHNTAREVGTTMMCNNLFKDYPIRLREFTHTHRLHITSTISLVQSYAIIFGNIRFLLTDDVKSENKPITTLLSTTGTEMTLEGSVQRLLGKKLLATMQEFEVFDSKRNRWKISGMISSPQRGRKAKDLQFFYINKRPIDAPRKLEKAINDTFKQFSSRLFPALIANIEIEIGRFDVNVTPDKRSIFMEFESDVSEAMKDHLHQFLSPTVELLKMESISQTMSTQSTVYIPTQDPQTEISSQVTSSPSSSHEALPDTPSAAHITSTAPGITHALPAEATEFFYESLPPSSDTVFDEKINGIERPKRQKVEKLKTSVHTPSKHKINAFIQSKIPIDEELSSQLMISPPQSPTITFIYDKKRNDNDEMDQMCGKFPPLIDSSVTTPNDEIILENTSLTSQKIPEHITFERHFFREMKMCGQFNLGFIITRITNWGDSLFIIDQHAADEKARFEYLNENSSIGVQPLIHPISLEMSPAQENVVETHIHLFQKNGFKIGKNDNLPCGRRMNLLTLPSNQGVALGEADFFALVHHLLENPNPDNLQENDDDESRQSIKEISQAEICAEGTTVGSLGPHQCIWKHSGGIPRPPRVWNILASKACRSAIMIGTSLTHRTMKKVVHKLADLKHPWNCPHGRPTMRHLLELPSYHPSWIEPISDKPIRLILTEEEIRLLDI